MEEKKRKAQNLKNRVAGINNWIQEHQEVTEPNMYEYTHELFDKYSQQNYIIKMVVISV